MNHCTTCGAPLAHDQRYCVECGMRRGPLPARVAAMIARILDPTRDEAPSRTGPVAAGRVPARPAGPWMPSPRLAAVTVMAMLGFGAEIGAAVGASGVVTLASAPLLVVRAPSSPPPTVTRAAAVAPGDSASSGGGPSGGSSAGSASTPAASPAPASTPTTTTAATTTTTASSSPNPYGLPAIQHVFVIMLADQGYSQTFGSQDHYLAKTLPKQGKLIEFYYAVAGSELANEVALVSGQGPTVQTEADCPTYANVTPAADSKHGQVLGHGCVYPATTDTIAGQLAAAHLSLRAYVQGIADGPPGQPRTCRHPALGSFDREQVPRPSDPYVTWRNPFVYFHSLTAKECSADDVDLSRLSSDLKSAATTPSLSYIVPDQCDDGSDQPCTFGARSGVAGADSFLRTVVPEIEKSAAYKAGGLIAITSDQAPQTGVDADPSACCATPRFPNLPRTTATSPTTTTTTSTPTTTSGTATTGTTPSTTSSTTPAAAAPPTAATTTTSATPITTTTTATGTAPTPTTSGTTTTGTSTTTTTTVPPASLGGGQGQTSPTGGGGQVGLLLISPWIKPGTIDPIDYYNHFSLLTSLEDIFNLKHLGYANQSGLPALDAGTFDGPGPSAG